MELRGVRVALIGYGEVGATLGRSLSTLGLSSLRTYDRLFDEPARRVESRRRATDAGVEAMDSSAAAVADADLVVSAVTADQSHDVAESVAAGLRQGAFYIDMNSASPGVKCDCARIVNAAGGRYVEMAVMAAIAPQGIRTPMLSGGPHASTCAPLLAALGFAAEHASGEYGVASAIKMCRSIVVKGMEAIVIESFVTARRHGVEEQVLASLARTFPGLDWEKHGTYFFQRVIQHGVRRAEEMREAAATVREAGMEPSMSTATAERQAWVAALAGTGVFGEAPEESDWRALADRVP